MTSVVSLCFAYVRVCVPVCRYVDAALSAVGAKISNNTGSLAGFIRRAHIAGKKGLLRKSQRELLAHIKKTGPTSATAEAGEEAEEQEEEEEEVAAPESEVAAPSASQQLDTVRIPVSWTDVSPVLITPTDDNPLGLTPGPSSGAPARPLTDAVVTELFARWLRVAFEAKGQTSLNSLTVQLQRDVPAEFGIIRKERIRDLLPDAVTQVFGHVHGKTTRRQLQSANCGIRRCVQSASITKRIATASEVAEATQAARSKKKRTHRRAELEPEVDEVEALRADAEQTQLPAKRHKSSHASKEAGSSAAAASAAAAATASGSDDAEMKDPAEVALDTEYAEAVASLAKVARRLGAASATVAELTEQEKTLTAQLEAVRAKKIRKQDKLKQLVEKEKELDEWLHKNSPHARKVAAVSKRKSPAPTPAAVVAEIEPSTFTLDSSARTASPALRPVASPVAAPVAAVAAPDVAAPVAAATADPESDPAPLQPSEPFFPMPELPPQSLGDEQEDETMADQPVAAIADASASTAAASSAAAASPSGGALSPFTSPSPVTIASAGGSAAAAAASSSSSSLAPVSLRIGVPSDAAALSKFARDAFVETFGPFNTESDMAMYTASAFSEAIQGAELADVEHLTVFIAEREGSIVGYAMTRAGGDTPECVSDPQALEIQRVYGVGIGKVLLARCLAHALWLGRRVTWLGVWNRNVRARTFYRRSGFKDVGTHEFKLGTDPQIDQVMERVVEPMAPPVTALVDGASAYVPLPESESIKQRVLHAFIYGAHNELERAHGCSVLQVACMLHITQATVLDTAKALVQENELRRTKDDEHYQRR